MTEQNQLWCEPCLETRLFTLYNGPMACHGPVWECEVCGMWRKPGRDYPRG
jgi:hypothetical protein